MSRPGRCLAAVLAALFAFSPAAPALAAPDSVVTTSDLDRAVAARQAADQASRSTIRALLARDEVRAIARDAGLDLRRAESAVATLDAEELQALSAQAAAADLALDGGQNIQISLIAALLIVIIIILLVD